MSTTPEPTQAEGLNHKKGLILALLFIVLFGILGTTLFVGIWHKGDEKAEAFSGLLAFVAATFSSNVTIIYVYLTNASLRKAQASISLQQEQLEQMKASVDLQRREWEQKVRVFPQFWITTAGRMGWFMPDPQDPNSIRAVPLRFCKGFELKVWNYSEQSFLVESILMQRSDVAMVPNQQTNYLQMVVKPHSVEVTDVSVSIMRILTQTPFGNPHGGVVTKDIDNHALIYVRLIYSDWSKKQAATEVCEFEFMYRAGDQDITIRPPLQPSGTRPSI